MLVESLHDTSISSQGFSFDVKQNKTTVIHINFSKDNLQTITQTGQHVYYYVVGQPEFRNFEW